MTSPPYRTTAHDPASEGACSGCAGAVREVMQLEQEPAQIFRRGPFEILGECFSIYGRHFRKLILVALIVQIPLAGLELALADSLPTLEDFQALQASFGEESAEQPAEQPARDEILSLIVPTTGYFIALLILQTFLGGVIAVAVGMQYLVREVDANLCFRRAWWRVLTLITLGLLSFGLVVLMTAGLALLILPGVVVLVLVIYWSVATQAVVIEGFKPISSLRRSYELVRQNWWRTCATWVLTILVAFGLTVMLTLVLAAPLMLLGDDGLSGPSARIANALMGVVSNAIIAPIVGVAGTLIYLDLRSRKEDFDLQALSEQMGISPANGEFA